MGKSPMYTFATYLYLFHHLPCRHRHDFLELFLELKTKDLLHALHRNVVLCSNHLKWHSEIVFKIVSNSAVMLKMFDV